LISIALVNESDEFFELMINIMRTTSAEGTKFASLFVAMCLDVENMRQKYFLDVLSQPLTL